MKLSKGDVYKWPKYDLWFKVIRVHRGSPSQLSIHFNNLGTYRYSQMGIKYYIKSNKLIKIPQLYK